MKKMLKTNGINISEYKIGIVPYTVKSGGQYEKISLEVVAENKKYAYEIHQDTRYPSIAEIKANLESSFAKALDKKLNVEVAEYKERDYLFISFQSIGERQYTGRRTL